MHKITPEESLNLKRLLRDSDAQDNTEYIRRVKHSEKIRDDIRTLDRMKNTEMQLYQDDREKFTELSKTKCHFLFSNYTDIFNRVKKDELNLNILGELLNVLEKI